MPKPKNYSLLPKKKKGIISKDKRLIRLLKIILEFNSHRGINIRQFESEMKVSKRTILRDLNDLKEAGFPIDKNNSQSTFYHLVENENLLAKLEKLSHNHQLIAQYIMQLQAMGLEQPNDMPSLLQEQVNKLNQQEHEESLHTKALPRSQFLSLFTTDSLCSNAGFQKSILNHLFIQHLRHHDYKKALSTAEYLLKMDHNPRTLLMVATCHKDLKQYDIALKYCKKALQGDDFSSWALLQIAHIYQLQGQLSIALSYIEKALAKQPTYWPLVQRKINLLLQQNKPQEALTFLKQQPEQVAGQFFRLQTLERLYEILGKWKEALSCVQKLEEYTTQAKPLYAKYHKFVQHKKQALLRKTEQNKGH